MGKGRHKTMRAACNCGTCAIEITRMPTVRLKCHCTICQAFTASPYSDVVIIPGSEVTIQDEAALDFRNYKHHRWPPPNLKRGRCRHCDQAFIETWGAGVVEIAFIRAATFEYPELLPPVGAHVFYEHCIAKARDGVPKYRGYFSSQFAIGRLIMNAL